MSNSNCSVLYRSMPDEVKLMIEFANDSSKDTPRAPSFKLLPYALPKMYVCGAVKDVQGVFQRGLSLLRILDVSKMHGQTDSSRKFDQLFLNILGLSKLQP